MKIMQVVTHIGDESAGPSYSVPSLCTSLQKLGCEVCLYTLADIPNKKFNFQIKNFPIDSFPTPALGRSKQMYEEMLKDAKDFDLIHSHMLWMAPNYYSGLIANKFDLPYVCSPRGTLSKWAINRSKWKKKIVSMLGQRKALDTVSCFHATADSEADEIFEYGYKNTDCTVIPNGIDIPDLINVEKSERKKLVFLSRIHEKKGIENLINAWVKIEELFSEWDLFIVGPTNNQYAKNLIELVETKKYNRINFTGEIKGQDKINFLMESDLFVLPTFSENFGMVVAESLACKIPVICTKGAPWEGLIEKKAGWWIDIGVEPLKTTLIEAMSLDDTKREEMGINGREWMKSDFSWDKIAKDMILTYEWLIQKEKKNKPNFIYKHTGN